MKAERSPRSRASNATVRSCANVRTVVKPGTTLVFTDKPVNAEAQRPPNFKIVGLGDVAAR